MRILITGSLGLIGSEAVKFYKGHDIIGIDNNQRSKWFGTEKPEIYDQERKGDHAWYISDVSKFRSHYPKWNYTYDIRAIIEEIYANVQP